MSLQMTQLKGPQTTDSVARFDWSTVAAELNERGCARLPAVLSAQECSAIVRLYRLDDLFRNTIVMARHNFGRGEYRYFRYALPSAVQTMREALYPHLVPIANDWYSKLELDVRFPHVHEEFIDRCHAAGQGRPTPLLLRYGAGDYNCLHQDLYGEHVFPLQVAVLLSQPARDFTGGEFVLTEQRPRMQSRAEVVSLEQGDAVVFAVHQRPVAGTRGVYRVNMRHGVSRIITGNRYTLGVIFHDAT
jgi:uncharacterized protein